MADQNETGADGDVMVVDGFPSEEPKQSGQNVKEPEKGRRKYVKRKRALLDGDEEKEAFLGRCREELDELFQYFKDALVPKLSVEDAANCSDDTLIACFIEGSSLSLPKLVDEIYGKMGTREGITVEKLLGHVPFVGSRIKYGIDNGNLNLLEDESESCLWCWEVRELSSLPKNQRGVLKCLRTARNKVHARIAALSATITVVSSSESQDKSVLLKASKKLGQELNLGGIRTLVDRSIQKNSANMAEKEAKVKEKELAKEIERNKRNAEKEMKKKDLELQKEKARSEKELKRLKEEADKEQRRHEKEEVELKKQLKRQQEADREQKRREKEEAEHKKQLSMRKQATIMERFLKRNSNTGNQDNKSSAKAVIPESPEKNNDNNKPLTEVMDRVFSQQDSPATEDLHKFHLAAWHKKQHLDRSKHWGIRNELKDRGVIKQLKLHGSSSVPVPIENTSALNKGNISSQGMGGNDPGLDKASDLVEEMPVDGLSVRNEVASIGIRIAKKSMKLLQFDKSHRPAYYGSWSKKSGVICPRHPLVKDPDLDYDVDSDEEWEEEEPGESLSDSDKENDEETEDLKADVDDDSEDSFLVPDGYLSENEGVQMDGSTSDMMGDEARSSADCMQEIESEEFRLLLQRQKHLRSLTEKALRKSQPLIISNLMHEKDEPLAAEDLNGTAKIEQIFLQALCMQTNPGGSVTELSIDESLDDDDEGICQSQPKSGATPGNVSATIPDSDLPEFVKSIQSYSQGISKVVESLQQKFPSFAKTHIKNKVREISDFIDYRWQVKKEVLDRLGLSPEKIGKSKGIATFFSKRCLPPSGEIINSADSSLVPCHKAEVHSGDCVRNCPEI